MGAGADKSDGKKARAVTATNATKKIKTINIGAMY